MSVLAPPGMLAGMTTMTTPQTVSSGWRLGRGARRIVLVTHIASAGAWLGIDVLLGVLVVTGLLADDATAAIAYQALGRFVVWPMFTAGVICLLSGLLLGLGGKYGLLRYWWVATKLVLNLLLSSLVLVLLAPGMPGVAEYGRLLAAGQLPPTQPIDFLVYPPTVSTTALLVAITLSVVKPWGRIRDQRRVRR
jgi:hypothetical protein